MAGASITSPTRPVLVVGALALALAMFAGWRIISLALAQYYVQSEPERAVKWQPSHPRALLNLAESYIALGRVDEAAALALQALQLDPLDGRGYRVLADCVAGQGGLERRKTLIALALKHGPRDVPARAWAAQIALSNGDAKSAIAHYDHILRVLPEARETVLPVLVQIATQPLARDAIVGALAEQPDWRVDFLELFARKAPAVDDLPPVFGALAKHGGLSARENEAYLGRFVRDHLWNQAFVSWADGLSAAQLASLATPVNGSFEQVRGSGAPFEWHIQSVPGVDAAIHSSPDGRGHALRVEFQGRRSQFRELRQLLLLPPGSAYVLEWRRRLDGLQTARGVSWTLTCADGSAGRILETPPESGTSDWQPRRARFEVPAQCPAQWLALELDARIEAETLALGAVWVDDVKVSVDSARQGIESAPIMVE